MIVANAPSGKECPHPRGVDRGEARATAITSDKIANIILKQVCLQVCPPPPLLSVFGLS